MGLFVWLGREAKTGLLSLFLHTPCGDRVPAGERWDTVLQWGAAVKDAEGAYVLNPVKSLLRAKHWKSAKEILEIHGIKTEDEGETGASEGAGSGPGARSRSVAGAGAGPESGSRSGAGAGPGPVVAEGIVREYLVPVFHLEALAVFERKRSPALLAAVNERRLEAAGAPRKGGPKGQMYDRGRPPHKAAERCGWGEDWRERYREVPQEEQSGHHVRRARREAARAVYALGLATGLVRVCITAKGRTVVAGVDPAPPLDMRLAELFADAIDRYAAEEERDRERERHGPLLLGADPEFLLRRADGRIVSASRYMEREGAVGCDAVVLAQHRVILPLAELRPQPSASPRELVRELRRTMLQASRMIGDASVAWLAGSMPAKGLPLGGHIHFSGVGLNERLLRALDNYAALPLVLAEGESAGQRRPRYGFLGDYRRKRHGGFEYRPLPSWLATPELAIAVLALGRAVALHYRELPQRPLDRAEVQRAFYRGGKAELLPVVQGLWRDLERLSAYAEYRAELDALRDRLFLLEGWDEQADFRRPWKIPPLPTKQVRSPAFML